MLRLGAIVAATLSAAGAEPLPEAKWLAPGADHVAALTKTPGECLTPAKNPDTEYLAEIGRAAFSSPFLLGGQAARGGLSCASCHVDGRSNPDFFLEGLSGAPGTADVSSSLFSKVRDDGVFNPIAIPSLVGIKDKRAFGTASPAPSLRAFIGAAVVEEFQGEEAPPAILDGLVAYIEAMEMRACPSGPVALTPQRAIKDFSRALAAAREAARRDDRATADFILVSAQAALGRIHARFPDERHKDLRLALEVLADEVGTLRNPSLDSIEAIAALDEIGGRAKRLEKRLKRAQRHSLYEPDALAAHLNED